MRASVTVFSRIKEANSTAAEVIIAGLGALLKDLRERHLEEGPRG